MAHAIGGRSCDRASCDTIVADRSSPLTSSSSSSSSLPPLPRASSTSCHPTRTTVGGQGTTRMTSTNTTGTSTMRDIPRRRTDNDIAVRCSGRSRRGGTVVVSTTAAAAGWRARSPRRRRLRHPRRRRSTRSHAARASSSCARSNAPDAGRRDDKSCGCRTASPLPLLARLMASTVPPGVVARPLRGRAARLRS